MFGTTHKIHSAPLQGDVTVRLAIEADARALRRLAALDSSPPPAGPTVVAEVDGELVAAVPVDGGPAIADPFLRTAALIQMLELRASQLRARIGFAAENGHRARRRFRAVRPAQ